VFCFLINSVYNLCFYQDKVRYNISTMPLSLFFFSYKSWHYREAPAAIVHIWFTMLRYIEQTFAIRLHAKTLFTPWHRIQEHDHKKFDLEGWAADTLVNIISRLLGFIFRSTLILLGLLISFIHCLALILVLVVWFLAPILLFGLLAGGLTLMFFSYGNTL